jgi:hypothetical protein
MCFCHIALASGEHIFLAISAGKGIAISEMNKQGTSPTQIIWQANNPQISGATLDALRDRLLSFSSLRDLKSAFAGGWLRQSARSSKGKPASRYDPTSCFSEAEQEIAASKRLRQKTPMSHLSEAQREIATAKRLRQSVQKSQGQPETRHDQMSHRFKAQQGITIRIDNSVARSISVLVWTAGAGAAAFHFWGVVPGIIAAIIMFSMCQIGAPRGSE